MSGLDRLNKAHKQRVRVLSRTVGHADLTAAATTETLDIGTVPAGSFVLGVALDGYIPFTGGSISAGTVDIGDANDDNSLVAGANTFTAAVDGQTSTRPLGIAPNRFYSAATVLKAKFNTTSDNVVNATAGAVNIRVLYAQAV